MCKDKLPKLKKRRWILCTLIYMITLELVFMWAAVPPAWAQQISDYHYAGEDFESCVQYGSGKLWANDFLTYSAGNGRIELQNSDKGSSVALLSNPEESVSLNLFAGLVQNSMKLDFDLFLCGALQLQLEDKNQNRETIWFSAVDQIQNSWQSVNLTFDAVEGVCFLSAENGNVLESQYFKQEEISIVRLCIFSQQTASLIDNISLTMYEPFMVKKLCYKTAQGETVSAKNHLIPKSAVAVLVHFTKTMDSGSVPGNVYLQTDGFAEVPNWCFAENSDIILTPKEGFSEERYCIALKPKLSSDFRLLAAEENVDFSVYQTINTFGIADFRFKSNAEESGTLEAECKYTTEGTPILMLALYNGNTLVAVKSSGEDGNTEGRVGCLESSMPISDNLPRTQGKAFVFQSSESLIPIAKSISYSMNE